MRKRIVRSQGPKKKPLPNEPDKNKPIKPDVNPDPTKKPGKQEPDKNDPTRKEDPSKVDPTRIDEPELPKP
jgi:hypothetical protein